MLRRLIGNETQKSYYTGEYMMCNYVEKLQAELKEISQRILFLREIISVAKDQKEAEKLRNEKSS